MLDVQRATTGALGIAAVLFSLAALAEPWSFGGTVGLGYDSNPGNAGSVDDRRDTSEISGGLSADYGHSFGLYTALQLRGSLQGDAYARNTKLSEGAATARLRLLHRPGSGFFVPVVALWGSVGARDSGSDLRDSTDYRGGAFLMEQLTTKVRSRLGYTYSRRDSKSRVFDLKGNSFNLSLDWDALPALTVYGDYQRYRGPIVVSAQGPVTPKSERLYLEPAAEAIEPDDAYGDDWFAFRLRAQTGVSTLGFNISLSGDVALDAQVQYAQSQIAGTAHYERWLGGVTLLRRF